MIKLIGVLIIVIGFIMKLDTIAVVIVAALATGLVSGMNFQEIVTIIGKEFVDKRLMSMFILTLPVIGILEKYGLKERAADLIGRIRSASAGRILTIYQTIRELAVAASISGLGGHVQFVRPLIFPMAQAAAVKDGGKLSEKDNEMIKGMSAAADNFGNFFAQNVFPASGGVLLIQTSLKDLNYQVSAADIAAASIPIAVITLILSAVQYALMDRRIKRNLLKEEPMTVKETI